MVKSVSEFVNEVKNIGNILLSDGINYNLWFRAENEKYITQLVPSFYRDTDFINIKNHDYTNRLILDDETYKNFRKIEGTLKSRFHINNSLYNDSNYFSNSWEIYYLMQHYGVSTRLLDWTDSALIALFFCVEKVNDKEDNNGVVWVINPYLLNQYSLSIIDLSKSQDSYDNIFIPTRSNKSKFYSKKNKLKVNRLLTNYLDLNLSIDTEFNPIALTPPRFDLRMKYQKSNFTIFGNNITGMQSHPFKNKFLDKIIIDKDSFKNIKEELLMLGITNESIYPGLDGIGKDVMYETKRMVQK